MTGWIRLHRSIQDHWIFHDEKKLKWWLTILLEVNYQDRKLVIGNKLYDCKRGESIRSLRSWAKMLNTTPETVRHFFKLLQKDGMITFKSIGISTHLRVCNYETYQSDLDTDKTTADTGLHTGWGQSPDTNKKIKKGRNEKVIMEFVVPSIEEVIQYFDENGYAKESAVRAYQYYNEANWKDMMGNPVKNWKQKMVRVWFKDEHKKKVRQLA